MGTICILLGLIILILFVAAGFFAANMILGNPMFMSLFAMTSEAQTYIVMVGICFAVGLLICLNLVMHGLTYNKVSKMAASVKKLNKR